MIITKQKLEATGREWPFLVDKIRTVTKTFKFGNNNLIASGIKYKGKKYALSGFLESHGYLPLIDSKIWADNPEIPGTKKSLSGVFEYIEEGRG